MTADQLFSVLNLMTLAAWLPLVFLPRLRWTRTRLPVVMPLLLAAIYVVLVAATLARSEGGFSSLTGVRTLFDNPWVLLAGWTHYLAFDLFIGGWEARDAERRGIPHLLDRACAGPDVPPGAGGPAALSDDPVVRAWSRGAESAGRGRRSSRFRRVRRTWNGDCRRPRMSKVATRIVARRSGPHASPDVLAPSTPTVPRRRGAGPLRQT